MASAQEPGIVSFYVQKKNGNQVFLGNWSNSFLGPGASADGVRATTANVDNQYRMPLNKKVLIEVDDILLVKFKSVATDGIDVSDCWIEIPITYTDGTTDLLFETDLTSPDPADYTATAGVEQTHGGWKATKPCYFGGGHIFVSIEDDTA